jgi:NAD(P)-dependent dehydrogenase (short-subunit alcohol dehydrogenase family)
MGMARPGCWFAKPRISLGHGVIVFLFFNQEDIMGKQFEGKVVMITGAASGIGRATALAFAAAGANVVVSDMAVEGGEETVHLITAAGGSAQFIQADVSKVDEVVALVQETKMAYGRLDIGINNAGIGSNWTWLAEVTLEDWHRVMDVNLNGVFYCMQAEIQQMLSQGGGVIVNTSSIAGLRGLARSAAYSASKHGVIGLTRAAALEYARRNIRINAICPVFTRTPLFEDLFQVDPTYEERLKRNVPMRRFGTPEDMASTILWLCSDAASFITGHALPVDGGMTAG